MVYPRRHVFPLLPKTQHSGIANPTVKRRSKIKGIGHTSSVLAERPSMGVMLDTQGEPRDGKHIAVHHLLHGAQSTNLPQSLCVFRILVAPCGHSASLVLVSDTRLWVDQLGLSQSLAPIGVNAPLLIPLAPVAGDARELLPALRTVDHEIGDPRLRTPVLSREPPCPSLACTGHGEGCRMGL